MSIRHLFISTLAILMIFTLVNCQQEQPSVVAPETSDLASIDMPEKWSEEQVIEYLANFEYPADRSQYKRQFFNGYHRSQLTAEQLHAAETAVAAGDHDGLAKVVGGGSKDANKIQSSSVYFYFTHDNYRDYDVYEDAQSLYGNMVWDYGSDDWDTNTQYMTDTGDVWDCYDYLEEYADRSDFSYPSSSTPSGSYCGSSMGAYPNIISVNPLAKVVGGRQDNNTILTVPGSYVFANLNPGFEDWTSGLPDAWQITMTATYEVPSAWHNYFASANVFESSTEYSGTSALGIVGGRGTNGKYVTSGYFELPEGVTAGTYTAGIWHGGNTQNLTYKFHFALYDTNDALIGTEAAGNCTTGTGESYALNTLDINTSTTVPKYVRFAVNLYIGQTADSVFFDHLTLSGPTGDISLPVEFGSITDSDLVGGDIYLDWHTYSEIETSYWQVFYEYYGDPVAVSTDSIIAAGSAPSTTYYDNKMFDFTNTNAYYQMVGAGYLDIFLGCKDYDGTWEYFEDDSVTIYYP